MAIKPSLRLALLLLLSHAIAVVVVYMTVLPLAARLAMFAPILLSLAYYLARDVLLLLSDSWLGISLDQTGVSVVTRGGSNLSGQVANQTTVNTYFVVLRVDLEERHLYRTIFSDALDKDAFRELCVRLKFSQ